MNPERMRKAYELYHAALERQPEDRAELLNQVDPELRREVESLLKQGGDGLLSRPVWELADFTVTQLAAGTGLGPYRIEAPLGAGGMGQVFRALDTRLGRKVALKTSREQFSARFEREARAISALNHSNICTVYDVGPNYLVMELVEGPTLAERLKQGPLPIESVLRYGAQIADALAAAHARGIIHRDLKPGNIMLAKGGAKVLDFGLAKSPEDETLTGSHVVMGTPAYMAPEQREGKACDARTDIYALGLVLYEMATGERASGATELRTLQPLSLDRVVKTCLVDDPDHRFQNALDLKLNLAWALEPSPAQPPKPNSLIAWVAASAVFALSLGILAFVHFRETPPERQQVKFQINPPDGELFTFKLSPDGRSIAFVSAAGSATRKIWIRSLDGLETRLLTDIQGGGTTLFWSWDGERIAFQLANKLYTIARSGGTPVLLTDAPLPILGGVWLDSGVILFGTASGLFRVSASGGAPVKIVEQRAEAPAWLPGRRFLYVGDSGILAGSLDGSKPIQILPDGTGATYVESSKPGLPGHLLFVRGETLFAELFNAYKLELQGDPIPVAAGVRDQPGIGTGAFTASANGVLVFGTGNFRDAVLTWLDRAGKRLQSSGKVFSLAPNPAIRLSPNDAQAIIPINSATGIDLWIADLNHDTFSRFTFAGSQWGIWSPDGRKVLWSAPDGNRYVKSADGSGKDELLFKSFRGYSVYDWSADGKFIAFAEPGENVGLGLWLVPTEGERKPYPYLQSRVATYWAQISPDNRWMAYGSNQTLEPPEVFVESIPAGKGRWQISTGGGDWAIWRRDGKELFYRQGTKVMAAPIQLTKTSVEIGNSQALFDVPPGNTRFQVSRDGQRFLIALPATGTSTSTPLTVDTNWRRGLAK